MEALPTLTLTKAMIFNILREYETIVHAASTGLLNGCGVIFGEYDYSGNAIFTFNDEDCKTKFILKYG